MNKKIWLVAILLAAHNVQARYVSVKNEQQFFEETNKYEFVIACFLPDAHIGQKIDKQLNKDIKLLQDTVRSISETGAYKKILKQDVGFVVIDTSKDAVEPLIKKYKVSRDDALPQFLLFQNGKVLDSMPGQLAKLVGFVEKADLLEFIDDYFGKDFDEIIDQKAKEDAQNREMQLARYDAYSAYRYPYGAYAPYNPWGSPGPYIYSGYAQYFPYGYSYNGFAFFIP